MFISASLIGVNSGITDGISKAGNLLKDEIKESISGRRAEKRSVDTGEFLKSIKMDATKTSAIVSSTVPQALFMEFGTSRIPERRHFRNSGDRNKNKIIDTINTEINKKIV